MALDPRTGLVDESTGTIYGANRGVMGNTGTATTAGSGIGNPLSANPTQSVNNGLAPLTGWAGSQGYTPESLQSIYDNPWFLLQDVFKGIKESSPGFQGLRDLGGDPLALYSVMDGSQQNVDGGAGDFANFMNELYKNLGSPGGQGFNARELLGNIFRQDVTGADSKNALGRMLGAGDMNTQIRTVFNLLRDIAGVSMNPLAASGYQAAIAQAGDRYGNEQLRNQAGGANDQGFVQWLNQNMPNLAVR